MTTDNHDQAMEARALALFDAECIVDVDRSGASAPLIRSAAIRAIVAALRERNRKADPAVDFHFQNQGDSEDQFIADSGHLNCPACGGSGHIEDTRGMVLVPVEPTDEMARVFRADRGSATQFTHTTVQFADFASRYRAMIAAATQRQQESPNG